MTQNTLGEIMRKPYRFRPRILHGTSNKKKTCRICHQDRFLHEFSKSKRRKDGLDNLCKHCVYERRFNGIITITSTERALNLDRSIKDNFFKYMTDNPVYFEDTFDLKATFYSLTMKSSL